MFVSNESTGEKAVIAFKEGSAWGGISSRNKIEGRICDARGSTKVELVGRWDECVDRKEGRDNFQRLWQIDEFPPSTSLQSRFERAADVLPADAERYYGFSTFAVQLNETTTLENGSIPRTDSRLRPDQLALERGDVDEAEAEKKRVEEKQRAKRKTMVDAGQVVTPRFFVSNGEGWKYAGQYCESLPLGLGGSGLMTGVQSRRGRSMRSSTPVSSSPRHRVLLFIGVRYCAFNVQSICKHLSSCSTATESARTTKRRKLGLLEESHLLPRLSQD